MNGFGKEAYIQDGNSVAIEIKALNSKQFDLQIKISAPLKEKEGEIRNLIYRYLQRGKIDLSVMLEKSENPISNINTDLVVAYFRSMTQIATKLNIDTVTIGEKLLAAILTIPDVINIQKEEYSETFWKGLLDTIEITCKKVNEFRAAEGNVLAQDIEQRIRYIESMIDEIIPYEIARIHIIKDRITASLKQLQGKLNYDKNRFEEELIYYLEKLDITEEKIRLKKHCQYFYETMYEEACGKKLGFILQEMGREINTLGSKATDHQIQQIVVRMKDELEKVKEQSLNIL
jgi:uncharacterized protein (TIGR00255 family)